MIIRGLTVYTSRLSSIYSNYDNDFITENIVDLREFNLEASINVSSMSEGFDVDGVTVILEWTQRNSLYSYQISVVLSPLHILLSSEMVRA